MADAPALRADRAGDGAAIRRVHLDAFPTAAEADLVDRLLAQCDERLSFVALDGDEIVAHLLLTPAIGRGAGERAEGERAEGEGVPIKGLGLAPLAVLASHQRRGLGAALTAFGLERARDAGYPFVVVLGHPEYYPRFGFKPASRFGVECPYPGVPDDTFMLLPLDRAVTATLDGVIRYRPEFG
ncbi:MAG: N-acetyltransferase [Acidobacteriota bacterium]